MCKLTALAIMADGRLLPGERMPALAPPPREISYIERMTDNWLISKFLCPEFWRDYVMPTSKAGLIQMARAYPHSTQRAA